MIALSTPTNINQDVLNFCQSISALDPFYVDVKPEIYSKPLFCFPNVDEKIKHDGGTCQYGWQIWILDDIFIEAEFHGIWISPAGGCLDITPKTNHAKKILFLPDKNRVYEGRQVNNIRKPLSTNGLITQFFETFDAMYYINNHGERAEQNQINLSREEIEIRQWLLKWQANLQKMLIQGLSKNSKCPCGSDIKYKRCCGKSLDEGIAELKIRYKF